MNVRQQLLMAAIWDRLGQPVGSDQLIRTGLDALEAGIDSPSLAQLAGLTRAEEPEARDLFARVVEELHLAPELPDDPTQARWTLVHWWCQLIADGELAPEVGGWLIWMHGYEELEHSAPLLPLIGWVSEWEDWTENWDLPRETYRERILAEARHLINNSWPLQDT